MKKIVECLKCRRYLTCTGYGLCGTCYSRMRREDPRPRVRIISWTESKIAELNRLTAEGKSAREIGEILSVNFGKTTKNAVIGMWDRHDIEGRATRGYRGPTTEDRLRALHANMEAVNQEWEANSDRMHMKISKAEARHMIWSDRWI
jgi:hypothetical protein